MLTSSNYILNFSYFKVVIVNFNLIIVLYGIFVDILFIKYIRITSN
jgi:hypothetical protein